MKIALIGDLHYPAIDETIPGLFEARENFYEQFIQRFLDVEADFHVSIGDLTNYGMPHELRSIYSLIGNRRNFYHTLGNHDVYSLTKKELLALTGQQRYHSFETEQAVFAFLDTARELDFETWGGWIDEEQLKWFEQVIQDSADKPLLVFAHHPVYNTTARSNFENGSIHPNIDMWKLLNQKEGVGIFFNGHTHIDSITKESNWTFVQTSSVLDQRAFRLIEIDKDHISISAIDVDNETLAKHAVEIYTHINHYTHQTTARGTTTNRNCTILLDTAAVPVL